MEAIYFDNAATTPIRPEVAAAMAPFHFEKFGNPSSSHSFGRAARAALEAARRKVSELFDIAPAGVVFTSGGTEADNLAVLGGALAARERGAPFRIATSAIEHKAVLAAGTEVTRRGGQRLEIAVDRHGRIGEDSLAAALRGKPSLVSAMWVNNETGVIQDLELIGAACRDDGAMLHTDAVQAIGKIPIPADAPWDLLTVSGHKIGAPKGVGALLLRSTGSVSPLLWGGGQQSDIRPGTENVAGAVGLARAAELAMAGKEEATRMAVLRDRLERGISAAFPDAIFASSGAERAPHICNVCLPGTDSESLLMHLDLAGVACSSGSACDSGGVEPSHVLRAMGIEDAVATAALRFAFAAANTDAQVDRVLDIFPEIVTRVRTLGRTLGRLP